MRKIFLSFIFLSSTPLFSATLSVNQFNGINTEVNPVALQNGQTPDSQNVVTDLGGVQGRKGFIQFSTQPAVDIWQFPLSNGTRYIIKRSSNTLLADTGLGTFSVTVSTIPTDRKTVASVLGDRFYFMNTTDGLKYWTGSAVVVASATLKGTMLVTHKARLWESGMSGEERYIRASKLNDGTSWTAPTNPSDDDATILPVSGALDENIQAIYASFQDKLIWFKKSSFGAIFGSRRSNFTQRSFSETTGVAAPETIQDCDGYLRWLGNNRKVWEFDGATYYKISDQSNGLFSSIQQGDSTTRSTILTSQADWDQGTSTPTENLSTSILSGSVVLSTMAVSSFVDTVSTDFAAGTLVNLDTGTSPGQLMIKITPNYNVGDYSNNDTSFSEDIYQAFIATGTLSVTGVVLDTFRVGSPGSGTVSILSDSSNSPGSTLISVSHNFNTAPTSTENHFIDFGSAVTLNQNTRYWIKVTKFGSDSSNMIRFYHCINGVAGCVATGEKHDGSGSSGFVSTITTHYRFVGSSSGTIVSRTFDIGTSTNSWLFSLSTLTATTGSLPTGSTITFQTQTSADGVTFDSLVPVSNNAVSTSTTRQFIRYKAFFSMIYNSTNTSDPVSPTLSDITILNGPFLKSSGTYTSKIVQVGNNISAWGPVTIGNSVSSGGTETFQIGSTNTASVSAITNWTTITNNSVPTISTNPYVAFRSTFSATKATDTVQLNDFTFSWTDGSSLRSASGYIDQRYWLAVATNSATNNIVYVYDRNKQWQRYSGINADCLGLYNSNLYFGNSTGIYQTEQGYTDAGTAITGYFKTKDYAPSSPDIRTIFDYTYITTDQSDGTLSSFFSVDGSTTPVTMGTYQMNQPGLIQNFRIPFSNDDAQQGKFINFKWQVSGSNFWRIINSNIYYTPGIVPE